MWGAFYVIKLVLETTPSNNLKYIPKNAQFVAKIDGRQLFEQGVRSIVLDEDQEIIRLIDQIFERKTGSDERKDLGIAFKSDLIFFKLDIKDENISGFLFNLSNPKNFQNNISSILQKNQTFAKRDHVGIVLHLTETDENNIGIADLQIQGDQLLKEESDFDLDNLSDSNDKTLLHSWSKRGLLEDGGIVANSNLSFEITDNKILIDGNLAFEDLKPSKKRKRLKAKNTHLTSTIVSPGLADSINLFFSGLNLPEADINSISINYHGTEIVEEPSFFIVPYVDMLIETNKPYQLNAALDSAALAESDIELHDDFFKYGGKTFHYKQLSSALFYIGITQNPEIETIDDGLFLELSGSLSHLTQFYGEGIMRKFLEIIPIYSASKELASKIDEVDFKISKISPDKGKVNGEILFKKENYALNALIHFAIDGHLLK